MTVRRYPIAGQTGEGGAVDSVNGQTGVVTLDAADVGAQSSDADLTAIAGLTHADDTVLQTSGGAWAARTPAQVKATLALAKGDVGLANVDNTSDAAKPVSTATQTALDGKQGLDSDLTTIAGLAPADGSVLRRVSGAWSTSTIAEVRADLQLVPAPPSGKYFFPASQAEGSTPGFGANGTSRVMPWLVERSITVDRIGIEVTTIGDVGSLLRLGIYADSGAGRPGALLLDAGTVVGDVLGNKEATISQALAPGIYWIGCAAQSIVTTTPTLRMISDYHPPVLITLDAAPSAGAGIAGYFETGVTGALSANFSATPTASGTMPRLFFRAA